MEIHSCTHAHCAVLKLLLHYFAYKDNGHPITQLAKATQTKFQGGNIQVHSTTPEGGKVRGRERGKRKARRRVEAATSWWGGPQPQLPELLCHLHGQPHRTEGTETHVPLLPEAGAPGGLSNFAWLPWPGLTTDKCRTNETI